MPSPSSNAPQTWLGSEAVARRHLHCHRARRHNAHDATTRLRRGPRTVIAGADTGRSADAARARPSASRSGVLPQRVAVFGDAGEVAVDVGIAGVVGGDSHMGRT